MNGEQIVDMAKALGEMAKVADMVCVVRCRDCKWHNAEEEWCTEHSTFMREYDFCSYGERGEENGN